MKSVLSRSAPDDRNIFLNVPFDTRYQSLFIALIAGLTCLGRTPRCVLEIADSGPDRLQRIVDLIAICGASVHDLSRVSLSTAGGFRVPRFNMPLELGIACLLARLSSHRVVILEEKRHRLQVSLSDLAGHDPHIHGGTQHGVLNCTLDCFDRPHGAPPVTALMHVTRRLSRVIREIQRDHRSQGFTASTFRQAVEAAVELATAERLLSDNSRQTSSREGDLQPRRLLGREEGGPRPMA